jgi:hypothetical protein
MNNEQELAVIFKELSPENQAHLLVHARQSRMTENTAKPVMYHQRDRPVSEPVCAPVRGIPV